MQGPRFASNIRHLHAKSPVTCMYVHVSPIFNLNLLLILQSPRSRAFNALPELAGTNTVHVPPRPEGLEIKCHSRCPCHLHHLPSSPDRQHYFRSRMGSKPWHGPCCVAYSLAFPLKFQTAITSSRVGRNPKGEKSNLRSKRRWIEGEDGW